jgi:hypothetical protein
VKIIAHENAGNTSARALLRLAKRFYKPLPAAALPNQTFYAPGR